MKTCKFVVRLLFVLPCLTVSVWAGDQQFELEVRPVLVDRCLKCHGPENQHGGLRLDSRAALRQGGDSGAAIAVDSLEDSLLWKRIAADEMPPATEPRLSAKERASLRQWIVTGASMPEPAIELADARDWRRLWSLHSPDRQKAIQSLPADVRAVVQRRDATLPTETALELDAPTLKPHLEAWYRADDLAEQHLTDEDAVTIWPDRSGRGRDLRATRGVHVNGLGAPGVYQQRSRIHGRPAVRFTDQTGFGSPGDNPVPMQGDHPFTIAIVLHLLPRHGGYPHDLIASFGEFGFAQNPGKALAAGLGIQRVPGADHLLSVIGGWGHDARLPSGSFAPLYYQSCVITLVKQPGPVAATCQLFVNGSPASTLYGTDCVSGDASQPDYRPRSSQDFSIMLGAAVNGAGPIRGDVAELAVYSIALDETQRQSIEAELSRRYGLTDLVDSFPATTSVLPRTPHPIDAFVDAEIDAAQLEAAPPANRTTLIRRAYFDLTGLPPSPPQIDTFVNNTSPLAWESLIIELLASPQYGERWGRHWLDVARYADTAGFETEEYHRNAWRYRDWVIKSLNEDKPYDRFVQEQLAGDELWPSHMQGAGAYALPAKQVSHMEGQFGTGFFGLGTRIGESRADAKLLRYEDATDWVDALGSAFLGMTIGCARCHDHKFDPISQVDYFALQAVFQHSHLVDRSILIGVEHSNWNTDYPNVLRVAAARDQYRLFEQSLAGRAATPEEQSRLRDLRDAISQAVLAVPVNTSVGGPFAKQYDGVFEIPTVTVLSHHTPLETLPVHRLHRGELSQPREQIAPALPGSLAEATGVSPHIDDGYRNRAQLALWLTRPDHPLTARVMVNRLWQGHFGTGLVSTPNDFGRMGQPPTHPELLDYLASELVQQNWSLQSMHRMIMTSQAYRRGHFTLDNEAFQRVREIDPENKRLTFFPRRRLEGEAIWDTIHAAAGTLNLQAGGPPFAPPLAPEEYSGMKFPQQWVVSGDPNQHTRRGVYMLTLRTYRFPLFDVFDAPNSGVSTGRRDVSTVAPQALWMLNNPRVWRQAQHFAARVVRDTGTNPAQFVHAAWRVALGRSPSALEQQSAQTLLDELTATSPSQPLDNPPVELAALPPGQSQALVALCLSLLNHNEFVFID
jgi:hypothetical protein